MEAAEVAPGQPAARSGLRPRSHPPGRERLPHRLGERRGHAQGTCAVLARMAALYRKLDVVGVRAVATSAIRDTPQSARIPGARVGSRGNAGRDHLRPRGSAPDSPGRGKQLAAARQAHADPRYRRRQRGNHRAAKAAAARGLFQAAGRRPAARDFLEGRSAAARASSTRCTSISRRSWPAPCGSWARRGGTGPSPPRPRPRPWPAPWRGCRARNATKSTACASPRRRCASSTRSLPTLNLAGAQEGHRHRAAARRDHRARSGGAAGISAGVPLAGDLLFPGRRARRHHRRPGRAQRGRRAFAPRARAAPRGGGDVPAIWRLPRARAQGGQHRHLLFTALQPLHPLPPAAGKLLEAAAYLHDVGHFVSETGHHKHSYYVVSNSDMPGFTERERLLIACFAAITASRCPAPCTTPTSRSRRGRKAHADACPSRFCGWRTTWTAATNSAWRRWSASCVTAR